MCWNEFLNTDRVRKSQVDDSRIALSGHTDNRNPFESDFGRVIFSSACRRLHDKTQVFPLTTDDNIHSRLTHSLEVMNIGLSFGIYLSGNEKFKKAIGITSEDVLRKISPILKTACLVHDIGNPPFGHFGEKVIQEYFKNLFFSLESEDNSGNELSKHIYKGICETVYFKHDEGVQKKCVETQKFALREFLSNSLLKYDYTQFDGNAEGFRILTRLQYLGDLEGLNLTFATLASVLKYPNYKGENKEDENIVNHKHGVFFTEKETLDKVMNGCKLKTEKGFIRHPLVFLMEAADSICYLIMDIEDANQKQLLTLDKLKYYINKDENILPDIKAKLVQNTKKTSGDNNYSKKEWISFRTTLLSHLMQVATNNFVENLGDIVRGKYNNELIEDNDGVAKLLNDISCEYIFSNREITSLEITGDAVISGILNAYIKYFFHTNKDFRNRGKSLISKSIFMTILHEHKEACHNDSYFIQKYGEYQSIEELYKYFDVADFTVEERFRLIRDFIACMTDKFALNHIRKLNGQKI